MRKQHKNVLAFVLIFCLLLNISPVVSAETLDLNAKAAILIDSKSGKILYTKNENLQLPPASTTKMMTGILALENSKLTDIVTSGKNPTLAEPSIVGLHEGEKMTMENILYSLLLKSANDAAVAIAEHVSGSVPEFVKLMNKKAKEIGATHTNFMNPNGLPDPNHLTTAHDLAFIAKYAMENKVFREMVATKNKVIPRENDADVKWLPNHNKLLFRYEGANGIKTGYTREAKECLVASATRGDQEFISVVLGAEGNNVYTDSTKLLDFGFENYTTVKYKSKGTLINNYPVKNGFSDVGLITEKNFYYTLKKGETAKITEQVKLNNPIVAPVKQGQVLGRLYFYANGVEEGYVNLVANTNVNVSVLTGNLSKSPFSPLLVGAAVLALFLAWNILRKRKRRTYKRRKKFTNTLGIR